MTTPCSKEAEIAVMATKIDNIEKTLDNVNDNLIKFIDAVDTKYATKDRVQSLEDEIKEYKDNNRSWVQWIPTVIMLILVIIGFFI